MGLMDKVKKKVKEQEEKAEKADKGTGDRLKNKVKGDNVYGDKQAKKEGSGGAPDTPRSKKRRSNFRP